MGFYLPAARILLLLVGLLTAIAVHADGQRDPELGKLLKQALSTGECFEDKYDQQVWLAAMEPQLSRHVKHAGERADILYHVHCEARRLKLPPGLVMAVIDVESRFDRWAVSHAGAVGLMQIMPFWPRELGMTNDQLVEWLHRGPPAARVTRVEVQDLPLEELEDVPVGFATR